MKKKLLVLALIAVFAFAMCACGGTDTDASETSGLAGEYQDEVSQRAILTIKESEDGSTYDAYIMWSNSAEEDLMLEFAGTFDGEKLEYSDGACSIVALTEEGISMTPREGEYNGVLVLGEDDKLTWTGSNEGETGVFVKVPSEE